MTNNTGNNVYGIRWLTGPLQGQTMVITSQMTIGRSPENNIVLPENTKGASGRHCAVTVSDGRFYVMDMGSTYGTIGNGTQAIPPNQPVILNTGDRISLGENGATFEVVSMPKVDEKSGQWTDVSIPVPPLVVDAEQSNTTPAGRPVFDGYSIPNVEIPKKKKPKWIFPLIILAAALIAVAVLLGSKWVNGKNDPQPADESALEAVQDDSIEETESQQEPDREEETEQTHELEKKDELEERSEQNEDIQEPLEEENPLEAEEETSISTAGHTITSKDENGHTITEVYDEDGKLSHKEEPYYKDGKLTGTLCYDAEISCSWTAEQYTTPSWWILPVAKPDVALDQCLSYTLHATILQATVDSALGTQTVYVRENGVFRKVDYLKIPSPGDSDSDDYSYKTPTKVDGFCMMPYTPTASYSSTDFFWLTDVYYLK